MGQTEFGMRGRGKRFLSLCCVSKKKNEVSQGFSPSFHLADAFIHSKKIVWCLKCGPLMF